MRKDIYGDGISYVSNEMSSIPVNQSNLNEQNRIKFVTDLAAVSRGKDESKNPPARYKSLLKEAAPTSLSLSTIKGKKATGSPSRPLEFLPLFFKAALQGTTVYLHNVPKHKNFEPKDSFYEMDLADFFDLSKYSYVDCQNIDDGYYNVYTNMRAAINAGIPYNAIPYNTEEELSEFRAVKLKVPMFVFNHLVTHTQLSKEAQSDRVTKDGSYWLPSDFRKKVSEYSESDSKIEYNQDLCKSILSQPSRDGVIDLLLSQGQTQIQNFFKDIGYPREIYQRTMLEFRYKEFVMTGWYNDPNTWKHLLLERNARLDLWKNWTQKETSAVSDAIKSLIESQSN